MNVALVSRRSNAATEKGAVASWLEPAGFYPRGLGRPRKREKRDARRYVESRKRVLLSAFVIKGDCVYAARVSPSFFQKP
jgi:hypothetical protein